MTEVTALEERYIETAVGKIYSRTAGLDTSPLIIAIHGWSQRNGWHTWQPLIAPLADAGFYVVSVDMPGWGKSPKLNGDTLTSEAGVEVTLSISTALGHNSAILLGKSWGGGIAIECALRHPDRFSKLILSAPAYHDIDQLETLSQPVLLAWSEDDPVIPYRFATVFKSTIPESKLVSFPTGGHNAASANAVDFAPFIIDFLRGK